MKWVSGKNRTGYFYGIDEEVTMDELGTYLVNGVGGFLVGWLV